MQAERTQAVGRAPHGGHRDDQHQDAHGRLAEPAGRPHRERQQNERVIPRVAVEWSSEHDSGADDGDRQQRAELEDAAGPGQSPGPRREREERRSHGHDAKRVTDPPHAPEGPVGLASCGTLRQKDRCADRRRHGGSRAGPQDEQQPDIPQPGESVVESRALEEQGREQRLDGIGHAGQGSDADAVGRETQDRRPQRDRGPQIGSVQEQHREGDTAGRPERAHVPRDRREQEAELSGEVVAERHHQPAGQEREALGTRLLRTGEEGFLAKISGHGWSS